MPVELIRTNETAPIVYRGFTHTGKISFWDVPQSFCFPSDICQQNGFRLWLKGMPDYEVNTGGQRTRKPIKPFRDFGTRRLPKDNSVLSQFKKSWAPLFRFMEEGIEVPINSQSLSAQEFNQLYKDASDYVKTRCSFIFSNRKWNPDGWSISTWANKVSRSVVLKLGTEEDKSYLAMPTRHQGPKPAGQKRKRDQKQQNKVRRKTRITQAAAASEPPLTTTAPVAAAAAAAAPIAATPVAAVAAPVTATPMTTAPVAAAAAAEQVAATPVATAPVVAAEEEEQMTTSPVAAAGPVAAAAVVATQRTFASVFGIGMTTERMTAVANREGGRRGTGTANKRAQQPRMRNAAGQLRVVAQPTRPRAPTAFTRAFAMNPQRATHLERQHAEREKARRLQELQKIGAGKCAISGCKNEHYILRANNKCDVCKKVVHHLCSMDHNLYCSIAKRDYCSLACKNSVVTTSKNNT